MRFYKLRKVMIVPKRRTHVCGFFSTAQHRNCNIEFQRPKRQYLKLIYLNT